MGMTFKNVISLFSRKRKNHTVIRLEDALEDIARTQDIILGHSMDTGEAISLPMDEWARHCLVVGMSGVGKGKFREWIFLQQIARGGGLLYADSTRNYDGLNNVRRMCHLTGRENDLLEIDLDTGGFGSTYNQILFRDSVGGASMSDMIGQNKIVYVMLPAFKKPKELHMALFRNFASTVAHVQNLPMEDRPKIPFLNFMSEYGAYAAIGDSLSFRQATMANIAMVQTLQSIATVDNLGREVKDMVLENTRTKVFFKTGTQSGAWPGAGYIDPSVTEDEFIETRKRLGVGEAIVVGALDTKIRRIRIPNLK